ncbi:hypothetical protein DL98DRAFT_619611 [Cadophora sp. DSE1049]|nr:hypothetical protein DL98DRAFT_619611 [Cadophora sp. DSE1049]
MNPQKPFPQAGEMFDLQLTFESEVFPALESFVRFGRQRNFHKALEIYSKKLEKHLDDAFLVTIEYADLLFEQGDYGKLSEFLGSRTAAREKAKVGHLVLEQSGADEEDQLLEVMKSLADIFREGALRQALVQARKCKDFLARKYQEGLKYPKKLPTNIQVSFPTQETYIKHSD